MSMRRKDKAKTGTGSRKQCWDRDREIITTGI